MPRISLYRPERGLDYKFHDRQASEMFTLGGTDLYLHKYLGTKAPTTGTADQPIYGTLSPTNIQDLLLLENRDRKYDSEIYRIRGHYNVANIDFNISQFGLFIDNDTIYMTVHINDFIDTVGRKPLSGDVFELPHLRDNFALNDYDLGLPRYYQITDVGRASEGFSPTWYPHLYRLKCTKISNSQQFADILDQPATDANGNPSDKTLRQVMSTLASQYSINDAVIQQAEADAAKSGYETRQFFTLAVDPTTGKPSIQTADEDDLTVDQAKYLRDAATLGTTDDTTGVTADDALLASAGPFPVRTGYTGYLVGDGAPMNGADFGFGIQFPAGPQKDDYFLRTDFLPNRLFFFDGGGWIKVEDAVRMTMSNTDTRQTLKTSFINNTAYIYNDAVLQTYITLAAGAIQIQTQTTWNAAYATAPYLVLKLDTTELPYTISDYTGQTLVTSYTSGANTYLQINLPIVNSTQQTIPYDGQWKIGLYANRESQRTSLSQALKPRADL
jgi:hypothetical protein